MPAISIKPANGVTYAVVPEMFGGNTVLTRNTDDGRIQSEHAVALEALGVGPIRYPAGMPDTLFADGMVTNGSLIPQVVSFLDWASDQGVPVLLVLPTGSGYHGPDEMSEFLDLILADYSHVIDALQIGNEYWGYQDENTYGQIANEIIEVLLGVEEAVYEEVPILIQMANPAGAETSFGRDYGGWLSRIDGANNAIISQLSDDSKQRINGVTEHYYFNKSVEDFDGSSAQFNYIDIDYSVWTDAFERDLGLHITEWNVRSANLDHLGMRSASTILEQFSFMLRQNVDSAYVWPPQHNTSNDLAGSNSVIVDESSGIVVNSITGALFSLMSRWLPGTSMLETMDISDVQGIETHYFTSDSHSVIYIASVSQEVLDFSFDYSMLPAGNEANITKIGIDQNSSNGMHWSSQESAFVEANYIEIDNQSYFYNEHDVRASIDQWAVPLRSDATSIELSLLPYEVVQITVEHEPQAFGEVGTVELNHVSQTITLENDYENPIAVAFVMSERGVQPVDARIVEVVSNQLTIRLQEPNTYDGRHATETVSYLVVEEGSWRLPSGLLVEAGTEVSESSSRLDFETVDFEAEFEFAPSVFSSLQTQSMEDFSIVRHRNIDADSFQFALQGEEAEDQNRGWNSGSELGWIAIEKGAATIDDNVLISSTADQINHFRSSIEVNQAHPVTEVLIADLASTNGADAAWVRGSQAASGELAVFVREERSLDREVSHIREQVDFLWFENEGGLVGYQVDI